MAAAPRPARRPAGHTSARPAVPPRPIGQEGQPASTPPPAQPPVEEPQAQEPTGEPSTPAAPQVPFAEHDPLADLADALPLEPSVAAPQRAAPLPLAVPTDTERRAADLFYQIAAERAPLAENAVEVEPRRAPRPSRWGRRILYLLVLVAALVPRFTGGLSAGLVAPRPGVLAFVAALDALPTGRPVLLSFDYSPTFAGEMDPLAEALADRLAERSVPMLIMSTNPAGLGLAEGVLSSVEEGRGLEYGTDYVLLGFVPGEAAGLATLSGTWSGVFPQDAVQGRPPAEYPLVEGIGGPGDVEEVFVFADDALVARRWVEQVQSRLGLRLHALTPARLEAALMPYHEAGQLSSLIAGTAGAAEFERASGREGAALRMVDGLLALAALLALVALAANIIPALRDRRKGSR